MTGHPPPRLALSLLGRCFPLDDPLTGDLIEEFSTGRSRAWFWIQVLTAAGCRAPMRLRLTGLLAAVLLIAPVAGYVAYARIVSARTDVPGLIQWMTIEQLRRSMRTEDVLAPLRADAGMVDVTGVLARVIRPPDAGRRRRPALLVTSSFQIPRFGAVFLLDPSVDVEVLTPGERVTLRCPVLDAHVSESLCVVVPE